MKTRLQFCFSGASAFVLDLAEAFSLLALLDLLIDLWDRFRGRIHWQILKTADFWIGTACGFLAGFMLMNTWPEAIVLVFLMVAGMLKANTSREKLLERLEFVLSVMKVHGAA